jgi:glycosyltransferase involved in cell wall biosynthesis
MTNIVRHGATGLLVDAADANSLAAALCDLLADPQRARQMGDAGRARALEAYSWDRTTDLLIEYFQDVVDARPLHGEDKC